MGIETVTILMVSLMLLLLVSGLPVLFVLGGSGILFGYLLWGPSSVQVVIANLIDIIGNTVLVAVPLFMFMAYILERAGIAEEMYHAMHVWLGGLRGGLAVGTIIICTIVAAMSGVSATGVVMMGIIALPAMLKRKYDEKLTLGTIMAGGALGQLIPPSVFFIVYALITSESVGRMFIAGILPGLLLSSLFIIYILVRCGLNPALGPPIPVEERATLKEKIIAVKGVVFPVLLVVIVLGSMFAGIATPTEAAAAGSFGACLCAYINKRKIWSMLADSARRTILTTGMVMWIVFSAGVFATIYQGMGATDLMLKYIKELSLNPWVLMIIIQIIWLIMGCLMDGLSILMITAPVFIPLAKFVGFDLVWFGVLFVVNCEFGFISPPFGMNLFIMKGIAPEKITMADIYKSSLPFLALQLTGLIIIIIFPRIATFLPDLVFGK